MKPIFQLHQGSLNGTHFGGIKQCKFPLPFFWGLSGVIILPLFFFWGGGGGQTINADVFIVILRDFLSKKCLVWVVI